eukprot:m.641257 g.641257  ORF g.641257 m.641257 type:complete len:528 (-) comp22629_c0_seq4:1099-2682(-)
MNGALLRTIMSALMTSASVLRFTTVLLSMCGACGGLSTISGITTAAQEKLDAFSNKLQFLNLSQDDLNASQQLSDDIVLLNFIGRVKSQGTLPDQTKKEKSFEDKILPGIIIDRDADKYTYDPPSRETPAWPPRFDRWIARDQHLLDPAMPRLSVGITISIKPNESSIFTNGAKQAAYFLRETLKHRHDVVLINLDLGSVSTQGEDWGVHDMNIVTYTESRAMFFDIVIEQGMQLSLEHVQALQNNGTKVVSFRTGNDYFLMIENMMFRKGKSSLFNTHGYDMVWTIPSFNATASFQHIAFRSDVHVAPYVWSPFFTDGTTKLLPSRRKYLPRPQKTIATFEPNLNVVKTSVIPMVIVEALFRRNPALVHKVIVTNTAEIVKDAEEFIYFAASLDITQAKKIWFEGRYKFPWFVSEYADVVLSHQWANGLNFLYLDALHLRYPLVHNSEYFKDCGYYYSGSDLESAVAALTRALTEHDRNLTAYAENADECIYRWSVHNPRNIAGFETLMRQALALPHKSNTDGAAE